MVLTVEECANQLKVSPSDVMKLIEAKELKAKKIGTNIRISIFDLLKYLGQTSTEYCNNAIDGLYNQTFFIDAALEWKNEHWKTIEYNTTKGYNPAFKRALFYFKDKKLSEIKPIDINEFIIQFSKTGVCKKTVRTQLLILNMLLNFCVIKGYMKYNPAECIDIPKHLPHTIRNPPTIDQIEKVKKGLNATFGLFAYFLLFTGCRKGEALALRYSDIDRCNKLITINKSIYYKGNSPFVKLPKTDAGLRKIVLLDNLEKVIPLGEPNQYIFANDANGLLTSSQFQNKWNNYCKEIGLYKEKSYYEKSGRLHNKIIPLITPHQLRHAYATMLFDAGVDEKDAQELLGHTSIIMTKDVYTHISEARKEKTAKILNEYLSQRMFAN